MSTQGCDGAEVDGSTILSQDMLPSALEQNQGICSPRAFLFDVIINLTCNNFKN